MHLLRYNNPKLIRFIEFCPSHEFIILEYGIGALDKFVVYLQDTNQVWEEEDLINAFLQLCEQVFILSQYNVYHLDIKPNNIILTDDGKFKLIDFGLSIICKDPSQRELPISTRSEYSLDILNEYRRQRKSQCKYNPLEADLESVRKVVKEISQRNFSKLDNLLQKSNDEILMLTQKESHYDFSLNFKGKTPLIPNTHDKHYDFRRKSLET